MKTQIMSARDARILPDTGVDCSPLLEAFFADNRENITLTFEAGTYCLSRVLILDGLRNITLKGQGEATVLLHTGADNRLPHNPDGHFLQFDNCENMTVTGFRFEYKNLPHFSGRILGVNKEEKTVTLSIEDGFCYTGEEYLWAIQYVNEKGISPRPGHIGFEAPAQTRINPDGSITVFNINNTEDIPEGLLYYARLSCAPPAVYARGSVNTVLTDLRFTATYMTVVIADSKSRNLTIRRMVVRTPNEKSCICCNGDGIDTRGMYGRLIIEDSVFEKLGDDVLNVNTRAGDVQQAEGNVIRAVNGWNRGPLNEAFLNPGDTVRFYDEHGVTLGESEALGVSPEGLITVAGIKEDIAGRIRFICNISLHPEIVFRGNRVRCDRARALLIQSVNALVENNDFYGTSLAGILLACDLVYWFEMSPSANIVIRNNTFTDCGSVNGAAIASQLRHDADDGSYPIHRNIIIENNVFKELADKAVRIHAAQDIVIRGNTVYGDRGVYDTEGSLQVTEEDNRLLP